MERRAQPHYNIQIVNYRFPLRAAAALLAGALTLPIGAQGPTGRLVTIEDRSRALHSLETEVASRASQKKNTAIAEHQQRELSERLAEFAGSWNKLMKGAENGVWNAKEAKKTRQAFERLTHTPGWIE